MRPKGNKFQRRQVGLCETMSPRAGLNSAVGRFKSTARLPGVVGWSRAPCKVVNRHIPVVRAFLRRRLRNRSSIIMHPLSDASVTIDAGASVRYSITSSARTTSHDIGPSIRSKSSPALENFFAITPSAKRLPPSGQTVFDTWRWRQLGCPGARGDNSRHRSGAIHGNSGARNMQASTRRLPHSSASLRSPGRTCRWKFRPKRCCQDELAGKMRER